MRHWCVSDPITMEQIKEPYIDDTLLQYMETFIKDVAPELSQDDRVIWFNRGKVEVLRHLRHLHTIQRENMLGGHNVS